MARWKLALIVLIVANSQKNAATGQPINQKSNCVNIVKNVATQDGDIVQQIVFLEHMFRCPVVAEIAQPFPVGLHIQGSKRNLRQSLDMLIQMAPNYKWYDASGTTVIIQRALQRSSGNPMNQELKRFEMPDSLGELRRYLPNAISSAATGSGGILNGLGVADPNSNAALKKATIYNVTAREVVIRALSDIGGGFSLIVFAGSSPHKGDSASLSDWTLVTGADLSNFKISTRSLVGIPSNGTSKKSP